MNERIKKLWDLSRNPSGRGHDEQKFAESIVRECMRMCEVTQMGFETHGCSVEASGAITVKEYIAEHFGVEE